MPQTGGTIPLFAGLTARTISLCPSQAEPTYRRERPDSCLLSISDGLSISGGMCVHYHVGTYNLPELQTF